MTIYIAGNELIESDSMPVKLLPILIRHFPHIRFLHIDPTENWAEDQEAICIIDTVAGIQKATMYESLEAFDKPARNSVHDYDLYTDLQLRVKIGKIKKVTIIGIPCFSYIDLLKDLGELISSFRFA